MLVLSTIVFVNTFQIVNSQDYPTYNCDGGECHTSNHALKNKIKESQTIYTSPAQIEEYHFHVYFFQDDNISINAAKWIQQELIQKVINHEFLVVLVGINNTILSDLNNSAVPLFNMVPRGPHPCGSYEVWTPSQYFHQVLSWFMLNRGDITILIHPLTENAFEDHIGRSMWLGPNYRLNFAGLLNDDEDPPQVCIHFILTESYIH